MYSILGGLFVVLIFGFRAQSAAIESRAAVAECHAAVALASREFRRDTLKQIVIQMLIHH